MEPVRKSMLLHICCGPCSVYVAPMLNVQFQVTGYFYNPNLDSPEEYQKRLHEAKRVAEISGFPLLAPPFNPDPWKKAILGLEMEPEGKERCRRCINLRLLKTAEAAKEGGFDVFCTTMTVAPMKNADLINNEGSRIAGALDILYLSSDFKKKDGYRKTVELSRKYGLYRQNYCGCIYSRRD